MDDLGLTKDQQFYIDEKLLDLNIKLRDYSEPVKCFVNSNQELKKSMTDEEFVSSIVTHVFKEIMEKRHKDTEDPLSDEQRLYVSSRCVAHGVPFSHLWIINYVAKSKRRLKETMTDADFLSIIVAKVRGASNALKSPPSPLPREFFNRPIPIKNIH